MIVATELPEKELGLNCYQCRDEKATQRVHSISPNGHEHLDLECASCAFRSIRLCNGRTNKEVVEYMKNNYHEYKT